MKVMGRTGSRNRYVSTSSNGDQLAASTLYAQETRSLVPIPRPAPSVVPGTRAQPLEMLDDQGHGFTICVSPQVTQVRVKFLTTRSALSCATKGAVAPQHLCSSPRSQLRESDASFTVSCAGADPILRCPATQLAAAVLRASCVLAGTGGAQHLQQQASEPVAYHAVQPSGEVLSLRAVLALACQQCPCCAATQGASSPRYQFTQREYFVA
jgi:hypothetical protein